MTRGDRLPPSANDTRLRATAADPDRHPRCWAGPVGVALEPPEIDGIEPPDPGNDGAVRGKVSTNNDLAADMTALAVGYVSTAVQEFERYEGAASTGPTR